MFSYLARFAQQFQSKPVSSILIAVLTILIITVLLTTFVGWLRRRRQDRPESWSGLVTASISNVLKAMVGLAVAVLLAAHLRYSSEEFSRTHGGVSQRNYEAVQQIWGRPHHQGELYVRMARYTKKYFDKDGLEFDAEKLKATTQLVAFRESEVEEVVPGNAIAEADHSADLIMSYRKKGTASYPGFEVTCRFNYLLANRTDKDVTANCIFPLPTSQGLVHDLVVLLDDKPLVTTVSGDSVMWKTPLDKGQEKKLAISYRSRGLDYIRFDPGAGMQLRKYRVQMICRGVTAADFSSPIGCMTPTLMKELPGDGLLLEWKFDQAVTRFGMGVILPKEKQESYYVGQILSEGPWGMALMLGMVLVTLVLTGRSMQYPLLLLLALSLDLYYLLMANIADYWPGLAGGMIVAGLALTALTAVVNLKLRDAFAALTIVVFFMVFCIVQPLFVISGYQDLLMSILYVVLLAYVVAIFTLRGRYEVLRAP